MFAPLYVVLMALILAINIVRIDHRDFSLLLPGARRRELLRRAAVTNFHALNPYEFEELMCELLRAMGYKDAQVTQRARDGGFDVRATSQRLKGGQMLIECKRYAPGRKISVELVRSFHGVLQKEQAYEGWFVTTSSFTKPAEEHARAVPYIRLIDGDTLAQLYQQHILAPNDKQQQTTTG
jgi:restriction system protein